MNFKKFSVYIIQSLKKDETQTGTKLYEELKIKSCINNEFKPQLVDIDTKKQLLYFLTNLKSDIVKLQIYPVLHIEIHGTNDYIGLVLKNEEFITWKEILDYFIEINIVLKNELFLFLAVCHGNSIISYIDIKKRAPFRGIIGISGEINNRTNLKAWTSFYDTLFRFYPEGDPFTNKMDFDKAFSLLNFAIPENQSKYKIIDSEFCFDQISSMDFEKPHLKSAINFEMVKVKNINSFYENKPIQTMKEDFKNDLKIQNIISKDKKGFFLMEDLQ